MKRTIIQRLAELIAQRKNCMTSNNMAWLHTTEARIEYIRAHLLPHGSGIDGKNVIDLEKSTDTKIVIRTSFHHMNEHGFYCGWTSHTLTFRPSFLSAMDIVISGRDREGIKGYLHETFCYALAQELDETTLPAHAD